MSADSLIQKLKELKSGFKESQRDITVDQAIAIVRRHYEGRPAVEGKPLDLQTRDELLAYIRQNLGRAP